MVRVILASGSPRRHDLLQMVGIAHEVIPADIDEAYLPGEEPASYVERLARAKGAAIADLNPGALVIAADTIVVIDDDVLGKPRDSVDAKRMLRQLSGRTHTVYTAIATSLRGHTESGVEGVSVTFRHLSDEMIALYVATGEPMDKAGSYGIQGFGATIVERIEGDYFAVMGLSLHRLVSLLGKIGVSYDFRCLRVGGDPA